MINIIKDSLKMIKLVEGENLLLNEDKLLKVFGKIQNLLQNFDYFN
jgi:hypothetical protein